MTLASSFENLRMSGLFAPRLPQLHTVSPCIRALPMLVSSLGFRRFTLVTLGFCLGVIVWGAFVRATGSGAGCGDHWPNCNGELMPRAPTTQTLIELTHRLTSGLSLVSVVVMFAWARRAHPQGHAVRRSAGWSLGLMISEALLGAMLVKLELVANNATANRAFAMSLHLMNTFLLLAAITSTAVWAWRGDRKVTWSGVPAFFLAAAFGLTALVGVTGAVTALGDTLHQQEQHNAFVEVLIRFRIVHPLSAIAATLSVLAAASVARARAGIWATALMSVVLMQVVVGLINVQLAAPTAVQLVHLLLADSVWVLLVVVSRVQLGEQRLQLPAQRVGVTA